jgi:hypothetical protein
MKSTDRAAFGRYITSVLAYYRQDATAFILDVWWTGCSEFDFEDVKRAIGLHVQSPDAGQYPPKVADVVRALRGTTTDRAAVAWGQVMQAISAAGAYQDVDFGDPATHAAIHDMGGWPKLCRTSLSELGFAQHRFTQAYRAYVAQGVATCPLVLMGDRSPDVEYEKRGLPAPKAIRFAEQTCADRMAAPPRLANVVMQRLEGAQHAA